MKRIANYARSLILLTLVAVSFPAWAQTAHQIMRGRQAIRQERRAERIEKRAEHGRRPGPHAGDWLRKYKDLPPDQQLRALENDPDFKKLPSAQQQRLRERLNSFNSLPPAQRERILQRMEVWEHLTPEQQARARQLYAQIRLLPPDRKRLFGVAVRNLRQMPPAERERVMSSERFKSTFTEDERRMLGEVTQLPLAPAESGQDAASPETD